MFKSIVTTVFCILVLSLPVAGQGLQPIRIHGMIDITTPQGERYLYPGYLEFADGGLMFVVWGWPEGVELPKGRQDMVLTYRAYPSFSVIFANKLSIAVIPSDELWRQVCVYLDGFDRREPRRVWSDLWEMTWPDVKPAIIYFQLAYE